MIAILILAAGSSSRMRGVDKLLQTVGGEPLLRRQARAALTVANRVFVTLPDTASERAVALAGLDAQLIAVPEAAEGMAASLRVGIAAIPERLDVMVVPADMPGIDAAAMRAVSGARATHPEALIWRGATGNGVPGHPVLFHRSLRDRFAELRGDVGARAIIGLVGDRVHLVALLGDAAVLDLDTPEDWAAWRARAGIGN